MSSTAPPPPPPPSVGRAITVALETTQRLLTGSGRAKRWRSLVTLAMMAGLVGAGAAPPPLGLLPPLWNDPALRHTVFDNRGVVAALVFLTSFLVLMGGIGRSFTLGFLESLATTTPDARSYRRYLGAGAAHFAWSSALSIPLYLLLFGGESLVARESLAQITRALSVSTTTDSELVGLALSASFKFLLVLIPWTVAILPVMVTIYEFVPAAMVLRGLPPGAAFRWMATSAGKYPRQFSLFLALRYLVQLAGNLAALLALLPCMLVSSPVLGALLAGGWQLSRRLGGLGTAGGVAAFTVCVLVAAVVLYGTLCAALLPVSVFINCVALQFVGQSDPNPDHARPMCTAGA